MTPITQQIDVIPPLLILGFVTVLVVVGLVLILTLVKD